MNANDKLVEMRLIDVVVKFRDQFRFNKQWDLADKYRKGLEALGIEIKDPKEGPATWKYRNLICIVLCLISNV